MCSPEVSPDATHRTGAASRWHQQKTRCSGRSPFCCPSANGHSTEKTNHDYPGFQGFPQCRALVEVKTSPHPPPRSWNVAFDRIDALKLTSSFPALGTVGVVQSVELKYRHTGKNSSPGQSQSMFGFLSCSFLHHSQMQRDSNTGLCIEVLPRSIPRCSPCLVCRGRAVVQPALCWLMQLTAEGPQNSKTFEHHLLGESFPR